MSEILLALTFLVIWINPYLLGLDSVVTFMATIGMEFLVVHSYGLFMGLARQPSSTKKLTTFIFAIVFYSFFGIFFAISSKNIWLLITFIWLSATKAFHTNLSKEEVGLRWALMSFCYIICIFLTLFIPLPDLGLTSEVIQQIDFNGSSGAWVQQPQKPLAAGFLYFTVIGIYEIKQTLKNRSLAKV